MNIYSESRPWGRFEKFHENKPCTVKLIYVNANSRLSLQYHNNRSEFWKVMKGTAIVELDGRTVILTEGEIISIPRQAKHRVGALDSECVILEIAYGRFEENDIVRIEDDYNRAAAPKTWVEAALAASHVRSTFFCWLVCQPRERLHIVCTLNRFHTWRVAGMQDWIAFSLSNHWYQAQS